MVIVIAVVQAAPASSSTEPYIPDQGEYQDEGEYVVEFVHSYYFKTRLGSLVLHVVYDFKELVWQTYTVRDDGVWEEYLVVESC